MSIAALARVLFFAIATFQCACWSEELDGDWCHGQDCSLNLVQKRAELVKVAPDTKSTAWWWKAEDKSRTQTCSSLANHGSYFSVELEVGTPAQKFGVVVDTGSDAVIIPSCICQETGECSDSDRCFRGTNKSSTFQMNEKDIPMVAMEFGSGSISAAIGTDVVRVGDVSANMKDGLLLMTNRQLDITGTFEGILGLGVMQSEYQDGSQPGDDSAASWDVPEADLSSEAATADEAYNIPGFLRESNIDRFSLCFNDGEQPGVLRLNSNKLENPLPSVGTMHWGLEFGGVSVGNSTAPALFCGPGKTDGSCGAIPDSGTTVMLAPQKHIRSTFAAICDNWPRCREEVKKGLAGQSRADTFQRVLLDCENWLYDKNGQGLDELPSIFMHLGGENGSQTIELSGWSYVFEAAVDEVKQHSKLLGNVAISMKETPGITPPYKEYACSPAFGASDIDMGTGRNDDIWVIGTPLFYEYVVNYDRSTSPPSIAFTTEPCGSCSSQTALLSENQMQGQNVSAGTSRQRRAIRRIRGPLRVPRRPLKRHL